MNARTIALSPDTIVGIVSPDDRKRIPLGRHLSRGKVSGWRVYRQDDGKTIILEAIEDAA